jgi:acetate kinase
MNKKGKQKWEILFESIKNMNYGETITHNEISQIILEGIDSNKYRSILQRAKKELLRQSKEIESIRGVGYRVIEPDSYIDKSLTKFKQGFDRLKKGNDILDYAPVKDMSEEGRATYRHVSDRSKILYASMAGGCTELKMLTKKNPAFLPENIGRR